METKESKMSSSKIKGTVKWFNAEKGFGFVKDEDGNEYFTHHSQVQNNAVLNENDKVSFEAAENERGKQAKSVEKED
ncbi:MAG: cold shock domain-containing protein [Candidatus Woesearchaeota archaeon]|jgi:CspA family cold shock protein